MGTSDPLQLEFEINIRAPDENTIHLCEESADFFFYIKTDKEEYDYLPAHKVVLTENSDVFRAMLNGSWKEHTYLEIIDASFGAFKEFLQFFYLNKVIVTMENIAELLLLGDKYAVSECVIVCEKFLKNTWRLKTHFFSHSLAILFNLENLNTFHQYFIRFQPEPMLEMEEFLSCDLRVLENILDMDTMFCSEIVLFNACMLWIKAASNQTNLSREIVRRYFGDLFYKIRFESMSMEDFNSIQKSYGCLFTSDEYNRIVETIELRSSVLNIDCSRKNHYQIEIDSDLICDRSLSTVYLSQPYYIKDVESTIFSCNEFILLCAFSCQPLCTYKNGRYYGHVKELTTTVSIFRYGSNNASDGQICYANTIDEITIKSSGQELRHNAFIPIQPGFIYEIRLEQIPPQGYCTGLALKSEVHLSDNITVNFHNDPYNGLSEGRGLIHRLYFKKF